MQHSLRIQEQKLHSLGLITHVGKSPMRTVTLNVHQFMCLIITGATKCNVYCSDWKTFSLTMLINPNDAIWEHHIKN